MKRFVKTCMLWLLILALPVQVQAAVVQLSCEIGHQQRPASQVSKSGHASYSKTSLRTKRLALAKGGAHSLKIAKKAEAAMPDKDHAACAPCATCCGASTALPNMHWVSSVFEFSESYIAVLPNSHPGHIPEGLERPPRHIAS